MGASRSRSEPDGHFGGSAANGDFDQIWENHDFAQIA